MKWNRTYTCVVCFYVCVCVCSIVGHWRILCRIKVFALCAAQQVFFVYMFVGVQVRHSHSRLYANDAMHQCGQCVKRGNALHSVYEIFIFLAGTVRENSELYPFDSDTVGKIFRRAQSRESIPSDNKWTFFASRLNQIREQWIWCACSYLLLRTKAKIQTNCKMDENSNQQE